jgi:hypothetical protein
MYIVPPSGCCMRYLEWTRRRVGRPQHDAHCHVCTLVQSQQWAGRNENLIFQYGAGFASL